MSHADTPSISVVLPVYNGAQTIGATVESVLQQDFTDFELLVINDGSTDHTLDVLVKVDDSRLRVHSFENCGLATSRNRGICLARGKYVAFVDADDLWTRDKLRKQLQALESNPDAGMAYSLTDYIDEHGDFVGPGSHLGYSGWIYKRLLVWNFLDNGSNPLIRRSIFDEVGQFDETLAAAEDWDIYLRIAHDHRVVCVPEAHILYRIHAGAMSSHIDQQKRASFRVLEEALERLPIGTERDRLDRLGRANLNRYFARRVISTAASPRAVLPAFRYLWRWVILATDRSSIWWKATIQFGKAVVLAVVPHSIARPLLARADAMYRRVRSR